MARVVVIGAGAMGLAAAHRAVSLGHVVDLIEAGEVAGGMAAHFDFGGLSIERFYHFICKSDEPTFALMRELGIKQAIVCPANHSDYEFHRSVGAALAEHLTERLRVAEWKSFGVSWGLTLVSAIRRLQRQSHPDVEVVSILGGTAQGSTFNSFGIASGFADVLGAHYSILTAPIYLSAGIDRDLFLSQYSLQEHFRKFDTLDAVLLTCSNMSDKSFLVSHGLPQGLTVESLKASGAIGDVLGQFLDKDGNSVSRAIDDRAIGMPLNKVLEVPEKILSAAGPHKVDIIRAACRRGLIDTLITDDVTAELLLAETP